MISDTASRPIEWETALQLLKNIEDPKIRFLFAVGFTTAYRISTYLQLQPQHFLNPDGSMKEYLNLYESKAKRHRKVKINSILKECFYDYQRVLLQKVYYRPDMYLFSSKRNRTKDKPVHRNNANAWIKQTCEKYNVDVFRPCSHFMRKTYATQMLNELEKIHGFEKAVTIVMLQLDHKNTKDTLKYIGLERAIVEDANKFVDDIEFSLNPAA